VETQRQISRWLRWPRGSSDWPGLACLKYLPQFPKLRQYSTLPFLEGSYFLTHVWLALLGFSLAVSLL
jgi:hypothetical protein